MFGGTWFMFGGTWFMFGGMWFMFGGMWFMCEGLAREETVGLAVLLRERESMFVTTVTMETITVCLLNTVESKSNCFSYTYSMLCVVL